MFGSQYARYPILLKQEAIRDKGQRPVMGPVGVHVRRARIFIQWIPGRKHFSHNGFDGVLPEKE